jgi:ribosomal subunit interface protein
MQIQINTSDIELSQAIDQHVRTSIEHAMRHVADRVTRVEVHLHDTNAKKPGDDDKRCTVEVRLAGLQPLAVDHNSHDLYEAIKQAAGKARRAVERKLDRHDTHRAN